MNKYRFKINDKSILILSLLFCILVQYRWHNFEYTLSIIIFASTLSFSYRSDRIQNDKMFLDLFKYFNSKYDQKFNDKMNSTEEIDRLLIIDYLNFCAEEYMWYKRGRIPEDIWQCWYSGMKNNLVRSDVYKVFQSEFEQGDTYYDFLDYVNSSNIYSEHE